MPDSLQEMKLNPVLGWPWWRVPIPDPGPPWESILRGLDKAAVNRVAAIQLDVTKATLQAQVNAIQQIQEVLGRAAK
jgi:hypothetical protein